MPRKFTGDTLVLATHNKGKIAELRDMLGPRVPHILTADELGLPEPLELGTTFLENAMTKALTAARLCKFPVLAEDSGLCIAALNGAPGVYSADWAGHPRNFRAAMHRVLAQVADVEGSSGTARGSGAASDPGLKGPDRSAYFQTVMILAWPDGHTEITEGRVEGVITDVMRGTDGHGYDPIFMPNGHAKTFAEMGRAEKGTLSHRKQAVIKMLDRCC